MGLFSKKKPAHRSKLGAGQEDKKTEEKSVKVKGGEKKPVETEKKSMKDLYGQAEPAKSSLKVEPKKTTKKSESAKTETKIKRPGNAYRILVKPLITEKASNLGVHNKYIFAVAPSANKIEIAKAIDEVYGIKPISVNIIKVKGKKVRYGRTSGKRKDWKKAIITLPEGKNIKIYEGV